MYNNFFEKAVLLHVHLKKYLLFYTKFEKKILVHIPFKKKIFLFTPRKNSLAQQQQEEQCFPLPDLSAVLQIIIIGSLKIYLQVVHKTESGYPKANKICPVSTCFE